MNAINPRPINNEVFLKNLNKCQASVVKTNIVDEPANRSVFKSSFHLFFQESIGFQNSCLYLSLFEKIDLSKWNCNLSMIASDAPAKKINKIDIINMSYFLLKIDFMFAIQGISFPPWSD